MHKERKESREIPYTNKKEGVRGGLLDKAVIKLKNAKKGMNKVITI